MGLPTAAQDGGGDGVAERRGEHVAETLGTGAGVGTKILHPAVAPEMDAGGAGLALARQPGVGEGRQPGVEPRAEQVEHAAERPLDLLRRRLGDDVGGGEEAGDRVRRARRVGEDVDDRRGVELHRHLVVDELSGVGEHRVGELP